MKNISVFKNSFSEEVFDNTYRFQDENLDQMFRRIAKEAASIEENPQEWEEKFYNVLTEFKYVPGGRIISNAGINLKGTTYLNCYVDGFDGPDQDSMDGILNALKSQAFILKSEGGYGLCADVLRPRGGFIEGIGNETPGSVVMLDMWDTQSTVITKGSDKESKNKNAKKKIRKGAQMVTLSCWHPDIEEFITAKQTPGRLTKFNMSVLVTDKFIDAVKNNKPWDLIFPDFEDDKVFYKANWNGNIDAWIEKGGKIKVYKTFANANELWTLITTSTYNRNEPGVLFVDTINKMNNLYYCEYISATNPCVSKDTVVRTPKGNFTIEELLKNKEKIKEIYSYNIKKEEIEIDEIEDVFLTKEKANIIELELDNGEKLKLTPDHKVYTKNRGWIVAGLLTTEDILLSIS